ncbi:MAG: hypothetical protein HY236_12725 [Acidobacteria bacterium]|nr:hypothetical protein [Acidobacteriota bacterium]
MPVIRTLPAILGSLALTILGGVLFYFTEDPFSLLFNAGLVFMVGGLLLALLLASLAFVRSSRRSSQALGYFGAGTVALLVVVLLVAAFNYRVFFFHRLSKEEWRQDLKYLAEAIPRTHPNPFGRVKREDFQKAVEEFDRQIPALTDNQIAVRLVRLVALLEDGHSNLIPFQPATGFRMLPLRVYLFSDGVYVTDAVSPYRNLIGRRLVRIGNTHTDRAFEILKPLVGADNEWTVKDRLPHYLLCPEILQAAGIIADAERAPFNFENDRGESIWVSLRPVSLISYFYWQFKPLEQWKYKPAIDPHTPLYRRNLWDNYWFTYLEPSKTLYLAFNQVRDKRDETIDQFGRRLIAFAGSHPVERFVIDIRNNSGGDNTLFRTFVDELGRSDLNKKGRLFTLIGRHTFSAAVNFTSSMENKTQTVFVGEPTGAGPNHYGDHRHITLPNSKIVVFISSRYHEFGDPHDARRAYEPQVPVAVSHRDYFSSRDPVLEAALQY